MPEPPGDRRSVVRENLICGALLSYKGRSRALGCCIIDISQKGIKLRCPRLTLLPATFNLTLDNFATVQQCRLSWRNGDLFGAVFEDQPLRPRV
jgi:hypothetical protein